MTSISFLEGILADGNRDIDDRRAAARLLSLVPPEEHEVALIALDAVCSSGAAPVSLHVEAGRARALLDLAIGRDLDIDDLALADFSETAHLAYDETIAEALRP